MRVRIGQRHNPITLDLPLVFMYAAVAISGLVPTSVWTSASIPGTLPVWLLLIAVALGLARIRTTALIRRDGRMMLLLFYVSLLTIVGFFANMRRWWLFDLNAILCFFGTLYLVSIYWHNINQIHRLILFTWLVHLLGGLILLAKVVSSGITLETLIYSPLVRFGVSESTGSSDAWKIMLASRMSPYVFIWSWFSRESRTQFVALVGILLALGMALLSLTRTVFISFAVSAVLVLLLNLVRLHNPRIPRLGWVLSAAPPTVYFVALAILICSLLFAPELGRAVHSTSVATTALTSRILTRGREAGQGPDTIDLRLREYQYLLADLAPHEWIFGRAIGGVFDPSPVYPQDLAVGDWLGAGGTPYSHNQALTLLLKGGLTLVLAVLSTFTRYLFVDLRRLSADQRTLYLASLAGVVSYTIAGLLGGPVHYLTGMIPFALMFAITAGQYWHVGHKRNLASTPDNKFTGKKW